jgi:type I restriction enzyme M protein
LLGGIPLNDIDALQNYWEVYPSLRKSLFKKNIRSNYVDLNIAKEEIKSTIYNHPEFYAYKIQVESVFEEWKKSVRPILDKIKIGDKPKEIIKVISEELLNRFSNLKLIDKYDVYQNLMSYWAETMQDDVYTLVVDGWLAGRVVEKQEKKREWEGLLIPKTLVIQKYFSAEQMELDGMQLKLDELTQKLSDLEEENGGEDGLFAEVKNDKDKVNKALVQKRIKILEKSVSKKQLSLTAESETAYGLNEDRSDEDEFLLLARWSKMHDQISNQERLIWEAEARLNDKLLKKYNLLSEMEVKELLISDKWMHILFDAVHSEMKRISQRLTSRVVLLADRYEDTITIQMKALQSFQTKVFLNLNKMGFEW